jgi:AraC-like DNA-binding protein
MHQSILAVDCCEHVIEMLSSLSPSSIISLESREDTHPDLPSEDVGLIVIGVPRYPLRRAIIGQLRHRYPEVEMLLLRRMEGESANSTGIIRGEFILSDRVQQADIEVARTLRRQLPLHACSHMNTGYTFEIVRAVIRAIADNHDNPRLNLAYVARAVQMAPLTLSRILNREVGLSFRQLLRHTRIEKAKELLALRQYSVREVAARVGFSDTHYFSRTFKASTGMRATEYTPANAIFS